MSFQHEPAQSDLTVWGVGTTRTFRVHWMLHELGIDYITKRIESRTGETNEHEYAHLNPKQKIPTLVHGDLVISESFAIMRYLRSIVNTLPVDTYQESIEGRARYDEWSSFILMELDATSLYVIRRHKDLPGIYGDAPAAVSSSMEYFSRMLQSVHHELTTDRPLWGDTFSEIDILMVIALDWARAVGIELPEKAAQYRRFMHQRAAYKSAFAHNFHDLQIPTIKR